MEGYQLYTKIIVQHYIITPWILGSFWVAWTQSQFPGEQELYPLPTATMKEKGSFNMKSNCTFGVVTEKHINTLLHGFSCYIYIPD